MTEQEYRDINEIRSSFATDKVRGKKFFITGATGALARYIVHVLMQIFIDTSDSEGKIIILSRNEQKARKCFNEYWDDPHFTIYEGKLERPIAYNGDVDYIIHAGGLSASRFFDSNPVEILEANVVGTSHMLEFAKEKNVLGFLFFSSCAVTNGLKDDYYVYQGIDPIEHINCYKLGKQVGENYCVSYWHEYGVPAKIVRIGYSYGPYVNLDDGHLFSDFLKSIVEHKDLVIRGDGQDYLGFCYVTDAVRAFFKILLDLKPAIPYVMRNQVDVMTIEELAQLLTKEVFPDRRLSYSCALPKSEKRSFTPIMPQLLMDEGWCPQVSLAEGFARAVRIIEDNNNWSTNFE